MLNFEFNVIPNVFESARLYINKTFDKLIIILKVKYSDDFFIVGDTTLTKEISGYKEINSVSSGVKYHVLLNWALLNNNVQIEKPPTVTTGFPSTTFRLNLTFKGLVKEHVIKFDSSLFSTDSIRKTVASVTAGTILPDVSSCALAIGTKENINTNFIIASLSYSTFKNVFSFTKGYRVIQRTSSSSPEVIYTIKLLKKVLMQEFYPEMPEVYYFNQTLQ